jgi:hypothetical protein
VVQNSVIAIVLASRIVPALSKRDVEELLAAVDEDEAVLQAALTKALAVVLGLDPAATPWADVVERAAGEAGWPESRRHDLLDGDRDAMWDLAAELNELRTLRPAPGRQQREAVNAIERAIKGIKANKADAVRKAAATIQDLDRAGLYPGLADALTKAADEIATNGSASPEAVTAVADALGPGPLAAELQAGQ